jgi:calmodulin
MENFSEEQIAEFKEAFAIFDHDGDGKITLKEFGTVLRALGQNPTDAELSQIAIDFLTSQHLPYPLTPADYEKDPFVSFTDFLNLLAKHIKDPMESEVEIIEAFKVFDRVGSGFIAVSELRHLLTNLGEKMSHEEVDELLKEADPDDDGQINYKEFVKTLMAK